MPLGELSHAFTVTGVVIKDALIANTSMPSHRTQRLIATRFMSPDVVPEISCILSAKTPLGFELKSFVAAAQKFIDEHLGPVWGVAARLKIRRKTRRGAWALVFVDTEREASDDGWHDLTDEGLPLAKVFLRVLWNESEDGDQATRNARYRDEVTLTATHEIAEMLVDPAVTLCVQRVGYGLYSLEVADPVEEDGFRIGHFKMTDFVYPSWYEQFHRADSTVFDHRRKCRRPFHILKNGYASIFRRGRWTDHCGSKAKRRRFARENRAGHRMTQRKRRNLKRSTRR